MYHRGLISLAAILIISSARSNADQPNILIIMADDCTHTDLPLYGGVNAKTPNIDRLASQGMTFKRAYVSSAMCQPCRAELYTGLFPMRNGCAWNHSASRPDIRSMPHHLNQLGYNVAIAGKVHVKPRSVFPFEKVSGFDPSCVRDPTRPHDLSEVRSLFLKAKEKPFCLVIALVEPHVPWVMGDPTAYPPKRITLPPNIADTSLTREAFSRYLAEITFMDSQVGEILETLDQTGHQNDTLVLFTSEQGAQFPGCKWTNWDSGLHTALLARWPGIIQAGTTTNAIVQYADVLPTLVHATDIAGQPPSGFDGASFLAVLRGEATSHRKFAYGVHNNVPEGPPYPIRTVTNGKYRYIRNLKSDKIYIEKHLMGIQGEGKLNNPYWTSWVGGAWNNSTTYTLVQRYLVRPSEQLYETEADPYELNNLSDDPTLKVIKDELSTELSRWLAEQHDPGVPQDSFEALEKSRRGKHLYGPMPALQ